MGRRRRRASTDLATWLFGVAALIIGLVSWLVAQLIKHLWIEILVIAAVVSAAAIFLAIRRSMRRRLLARLVGHATALSNEPRDAAFLASARELRRKAKVLPSETEREVVDAYVSLALWEVVEDRHVSEDELRRLREFEEVFALRPSHIEEGRKRGCARFLSTPSQMASFQRRKSRSFLR